MKSISGIKWLKLGTLGLLYFVQGAPYGFQTACIPLILRKSGLSFTELGGLKALFLPWVCKPFFAPIIERTQSKKWWLIFSMTLLGLACLIGGFFIEVTNFLGLAILLFSFNLFAAAQDISVDSLAIQSLDPEDLGAGNTIQVVFYKFGSVFAGGFLLWIDQILGWTGMFVCFSLIYVIAVALLWHLNLVERSVSSKESDLHEEQVPITSSVQSVLNVPGTKWMVSFVLFYKLCERAESTFSLYMVDKKVPMSQLAFWSTIMRTCSLLGSTYGGWALSGSGQTSTPDSIILKFSSLRSVSIFCQLLLIIFWGKDPISSDESSSLVDWLFVQCSFLLLCVTLFSAGAITTAAFTLMMRLSQTAPSYIQGTHYTLLATCEVFGKLLFAIIAGWLTDLLGLSSIYIIFTVLAMLTIPFIWMKPLTIQTICDFNVKNE